MDWITLTLDLPSNLVQEAERYAKKRDTCLTELITLYLSQLVAQGDFLGDGPIVRRLSGILPQDASIDGYHAYLDEKHGRPAAT